MTHQKESEYEGGGNKPECDIRCPKAMPECIYFSLCCCSRTSRLLLSPTSSRLSNPLWQDSWPRSWGKADLDIGPIPHSQRRTSAALLTEVYFWYLLFMYMSIMFWWPKQNLWAEGGFFVCFFSLPNHHPVRSHDKHSQWKSIVCIDFGTDTDTRIELLNFDLLSQTVTLVVQNMRLFSCLLQICVFV